MMYKIFYTEEAERDLEGIFLYIATNLLAPETAKVQTRRIMATVESLNEMPHRHQVYKDEPWSSKGLRVLNVDNYLVFYLILEDRGSVIIVRIVYAGRSIDQQILDPK